MNNIELIKKEAFKAKIIKICIVLLLMFIDYTFYEIPSNILSTMALTLIVIQGINELFYQRTLKKLKNN
ncbi:hypothetical protein [Gottfriedia luciferensis]|uniref:hypothetical protein n=1 Tax=Gottfriedia luciferensis TaxID=178774 RepID=UPI000B44B0A6|nr:hypothetical protein [Gottfriedia luciferensis]